MKSCWFFVPQAIEYNPLFSELTLYLPVDFVCLPKFWLVTSLMFTQPKGVF